MVSTFIEAPQRGIQLIERNQQSLECIFRTSDRFSESDRTRILQSWNSVWQPFFSGQPYAIASESTKAIKSLISRIRLFKAEYGPQLNTEMLASVDALCEHLPAAVRVSHGLALISEKITQRRDALKAVEDLHNGFELIANNLLLYADWAIRTSHERDVTISTLRRTADLNRLNEWFNALKFRSKQDKETASQYKASTLVFMKAILWDLSAISGDTDLVPFVLDGQVIYLNAGLAEGKALRRISKPPSEEDVDWITVEPDDNPIDLTAIRRQLLSRGYKVSAEDSSSGHQR